LKPIFLTMIMAKFHTQVENQALNQEWDDRLTGLSDKFRKIGEQARNYRPSPSPAMAPV
jgi:hypothetical protein